MLFLIDLRKPYSFAAFGLVVFFVLGIFVLVMVAPFYFSVLASPKPESATAADRLTKRATTEGKNAGPAPNNNFAAADAIDLKYERLKALMESIEKRSENLQKLLATLVTVGTIFGLVLGLSTYFSLKEIQQNAEKAVSQMKEAAERELTQIRADFPAIGHMNRAVEDILREFKPKVLLEWDEKSYARLDEADKQEILLLESTFRAIDFFGYRRVPAQRNAVAEINRGFGRFYASRYTSAPQNNQDALCRAVLYLKRASAEGDSEVAAPADRDLGVLYALQSNFETESPKKAQLRKMAESQFRYALAKFDSDAISLLGLAWIQRREDRLNEAIGSLTRLIERKDWVSVEKQLLFRGHFNRACYFGLDGRLKDGTLRAQAFEQAIADLRLSKKLAAEHNRTGEWLANLEKELAAAGDLEDLLAEFPAEVGELRKS